MQLKTMKYIPKQFVSVEGGSLNQQSSFKITTRDNSNKTNRNAYI